MKTVYILGAGFSVGAGAPSQANIIREAFKAYARNPNWMNRNKHFDVFESFLSDQLHIPKSSYKHVELEDIFTPIDRCILENATFRGLSPEALSQVREAVFVVVGKTIESVLEQAKTSKSQYIRDFAQFLVRESSRRQDGKYKKLDPVSVISTNWDLLLDNAIYDELQAKHLGCAVVDYCCYISSHKKHDETVKPGLEILGAGGFNVKLLKPHGSLNWLQCRRCSRLYVRFNRKIGVDVGDRYWKYKCSHCDKNFPEVKGGHRLASNLIMPTFIKDLSNPQYKIIWQNMGVEISEANRLVFIGYSLPSADFEMRQLLSRMTRENAKIEIVDFISDKENQNKFKHGWHTFFGDRKMKFHFDGAEKYLSGLK